MLKLADIRTYRSAYFIKLAVCEINTLELFWKFDVPIGISFNVDSVLL